MQRAIPVVLSMSLALVSPALAGLRDPQPREIYKETTVVMTGNAWRVTDPTATATGSPGNSPGDFLPNPTFTLSGVDLSGALRAEAAIDVWGGHIGTTDKRFRMNGNAWITIPELDTTPTPGQCYLNQVSMVVDVPLSHLVPGNNTMTGTSGRQTCYNFNWGQWGWYSFTLRVFYPQNASVAHPTGSIATPSTDSVIGENPTITLALDNAAQVAQVDVFASYDGYDEDGDGHFTGYHQYFQRAKTGETSLVAKGHVGRVTGPPWSLTWDTSLVPDQPAGTIKLIARILGTNGVSYVTDEVTGLTLERTGTTVRLYRPRGIGENLWARAGATRRMYFNIPSHVNLAQATSAKLLSRTWNGVDGQAEPGQTHLTALNGNALPKFGVDHFFSLDAVNVPVGFLKHDTNTVSVFSESTHHGIEVLWPAPALVVRYSGFVAALCGDANVDPGEECDDGNTSNGDGCEADCKVGTVDMLKSPPSGSVYKEFVRIMQTNTKHWRVTHPGATAPGSPGNSPADFLPNPTLPFEVSDLAGAQSAQAVLDVWGGHIGTSKKAFRLNGNAWLPVPELATTPTRPECYIAQYNVAVDVPLSHVVAGTNNLQGDSGPQICYNFNWGQWGWYSFMLRVFYDPSTKTHPTGQIVSPSDGAVLAENPTITAEVQGGVERVEFFGYYEDFDTDGDGTFLDWQYDYHRGKSESVMVAKNHIGTATSPPWSVVWDTTKVPTQRFKGIKLVARVLGTNGVWYVTPEVRDLSLQRPNSVRLYTSSNIPERFWVRDGLKRSCTVTIPPEHLLATAAGAELLQRGWNLVDGAAESGQTHYTKVNSWTAPTVGEDHYYSYNRVDVPLNRLVQGTNTIEYYSGSTHHGMEILWRSPAVRVRYGTSNGVCGDGLLDWQEDCDDGNLLDDDGCSASCIGQTCGDGDVDGAETCDDGNTSDGDGCDANCVTEVCGNGVAQSGEACDDGNADDLDGCGNDCTANFCGDAEVNNGEECDDGGTTPGDGCDANCVTEVCGNGVVQSGEECDDANTDDLDGCGNDCTLNFCGDGEVNDGEACDDGNTDNDDACRNNCRLPGCGDAEPNDGEECDDGNGDDFDGCGNDCVLNFCGDGEVNNGEQCDDGNADDEDECLGDCTIPYECDSPVVNGELETSVAGWAFHTDGTGSFQSIGGEGRIQVDTHGTNTQVYQFNLHLQGDTFYRLHLSGRSTNGRNMTVSVQQHGAPYTNYGLSEVVDLTTVMTDYVLLFTSPVGDRTDARLMLQVGPHDASSMAYYVDDIRLERVEDCPYCGDGQVGLGERCDDGNTQDGDDCPASCYLPTCGDGRLEEGEGCDDGNADDLDACGNDCLPNVCGDGQANNGEQCDDGNADDLDACGNDCLDNTCGDGVTNNGEACDDGNTDAGDGCRGDCTAEVCGDGILDPGEGCDDGDADDLDGCGNDCLVNYCGDGVTNNGEQCDDGNANDADGCRNDCLLPVQCDNAVINGEFEAGGASWTFFTDGTGTFTTPGGEARVQITTAGTNVQIFQAPLVVEGSTLYRLRLSGRNTAGRDVDVRLQQHGAPYAVYGLDVTLDLTPEAQEFVREFTVTPGNKSDARLMLQMGPHDLAGSAYHFDAIRIEKVADCPICGDGHVSAGEGCDDGNRIDGDGCRADCSVPVCGDGRLDPGESCDDGNREDGDGCHNSCTINACGASDADGDGINDLCDPDDDNDGTADAADCAPFDATAATPPGEVPGLSVSGGVDPRIAWSDLGTGHTYDVVMGVLADLHTDGDVGGAFCLATGEVATEIGDSSGDPTPGEGYYYLVRGINACGVGEFGRGTDEAPRLPFGDCP